MANGKQPKHILELTKDEKKNFLNSFDTILSDCDGVLWNVMEPIAGVGDAVNLLKKNDKKFIYISNNSVRSMEGYKKKITETGIEFEEGDLIHPALAIVKYLKKINFEGLIYCVGNSVLKALLTEAGHEMIEGPEEPVEEDFHKLLNLVHDKKPVKAVVMDIDFNLSYPKFLRAELYLKNPNCILIVGATDYRLAITESFHVAGPGPFIIGLKKIIERKTYILGKPGKELAEVVSDVYNIKDRERALIIGDMMEQDVAFGNSNGFQTLLVLSGGTTKDELFKQKETKFIPDYYADGICDFVALIDDVNEV